MKYLEFTIVILETSFVVKSSKKYLLELANITLCVLIKELKFWLYYYLYEACVKGLTKTMSERVSLLKKSASLFSVWGFGFLASSAISLIVKFQKLKF